MKCFNHADIDAVGICKNCNKGLCQDCLTEVDNGIACTDSCVDEVKQVNELIDRNKQAYKTASAAHKRNSWLFGGIGMVFLIFGLQNDGATGLLSIVGFLFLIGAALSMVTSKKYNREQ